MGYVFVEGGGGSSLDETEITARASDVLVGKTTIDDNGEVVQGSIPNNYTKETNISGEIYGYNSNSRDGEIYIYFKAGAYGSPYNKNSASNSVRRPLFELLDKVLANSTGKRKTAEKLGIRSDKILSGTTMCGVAGSIPIRDRKQVEASTGYEPSTDKFSAWFVKGFYGSDSYVELNGRTIRDKMFSNGFSVFKNATFDSILSGVVSNKSLENLAYFGTGTNLYFNIPESLGHYYDGRYEGFTQEGFRLYVRTNDAKEHINHLIGCMFSNSVNLTHIKKIRFYYKVTEFVTNRDTSRCFCYFNVLLNKVTDVTKGVRRVNDTLASNANNRGYGFKTDMGVARVDGRYSGINIEKYFDVDATNLQGHHYLGCGISISPHLRDTTADPIWNTGAVSLRTVVTRIDVFT